ncbi:ABC transporter permease [Spirochaetes bacterium]|uniref:Cell division protein FtsX n=1 Tax=Candidatus Scatousia excrementipullorum TaxID=2840936 RepID=A0A9D9DNS4_9BACT|nr:ABC transporter permease [Candidatus Scatousia excrementipullorum]
MNNQKLQIKKKVKKHIPKDWLCELRILYRLTMETFNDIKRTGIVNLVIITTMAAILTIFGAFFRSAMSISSFAHELGNVLEISVYLKSGTDTNVAKNRIKEFEHVENVKIIPKDVSWANLRREMSLPDISNPLPDTLHVKVDKPENITTVFNNIKDLKSVVEDMSYAQELAKKIQTLNHVVNTITVLVVIIMCILTITIINNTIQLVIQSRKDEIEIMRLMGVSNWYIRFPLIMQGAFYGFAGSLIAILPLNLVQNGLNNVHKFFMVPSPLYAHSIVIFTMFAMGILFGAGGSFLCIKKHLQV